MFELKRDNLDIDPQLQIPSTHISVKLADPNGMLLKVKAEFVANTISSLLEVFEAQEVLFEELYGREYVYYAHHGKKMPVDFDEIISTPMKTVYSKEVQKALLDKAFKNET